MDKIKRIIAEVFKIDPETIGMEMAPGDIEAWDSLGQLFLIERLEKEFGIKLDVEEIFEIMSIRDIYRILKRKGCEGFD